MARDLRGVRLGALLHPASVSATLEHSLTVLERHHGELFQLSALFRTATRLPRQTQDNMIEWRGFRHERLGIPVHSLYGEHREPTPEMLAGLDALLVDLQDVGTRFYTFIWTLYLAMRACERAGVKGRRTRPAQSDQRHRHRRPVLDLSYHSFMGCIRFPSGMDGPSANSPSSLDARLPPLRSARVADGGLGTRHVVHQTGLPWVLPSPNMPTLDTATVYPGMCLLEATNLSKAAAPRGPSNLWRPWIRAEEFAREMNAQRLPGVFFRAPHLSPRSKTCRRPLPRRTAHVTDRDRFLPFTQAFRSSTTCESATVGNFNGSSRPTNMNTSACRSRFPRGPVAGVFPD